MKNALPAPSLLCHLRNRIDRLQHLLDDLERCNHDLRTIRDALDAADIPTPKAKPWCPVM